MLLKAESKIFDIALPIFYCIICWIIWSFFVHLICKLFYKEALFFYTCSACIQVFSVSFLVCHIIVLLLSPLSAFLSDYIFAIDMNGVYILYFPLQFLVTIIYLPIVVLKLYNMKSWLRKVLSISLIIILNFCFICLNFLLWIVNGRMAAFG